MSVGIYFCTPPREKFSYCAPVGDVGLLESHWDLIISFAISSIFEWTLYLNIWENTGESEEETFKRIIDSDNRIEATVFDAPNPEEVGNEDGIEV